MNKKGDLIMNKKSDYKIEGYITNLGLYNEGLLVGKYISFPITNTELQKVLNEIGINEEYEEWFFTDYDGEYPKRVYDMLREYTSISELNKIALALEKVNEAGTEEAFEAFLDIGNEFYASCANAINGNYLFIDGNSYYDLASFWVDALGGINELSNDTLECFFDYEALGRDVRLEYYAEDDMPETCGEYWCGDENATDFEIGAEIVAQLGFEGISNNDYYFDYKSFGKAIYDEGMYVFSENGIIDCSEFVDRLAIDFEEELSAELSEMILESEEVR